MSFTDKLYNASQKNNSWLCIGLDPDLELMPHRDILKFNREIISATRDIICAYKVNFAFYEALGSRGVNILEKTLDYIPEHIPIIGDAKRGDIGNTARAYARALFVTFGCDAATVNPYLGFDSIEPFISYQDKGVFILCHTSNSGAGDFQDILALNGKRVYELVAQKAGEWNTHGNVGLVVGATYPEELRQVRQLCPEMLFLIPGIGTQGGSLELTIKHAAGPSGNKLIIAVSRHILYASSGQDFAAAARRAAEEVRNRIDLLLREASKENA